MKTVQFDSNQTRCVGTSEPSRRTSLFQVVLRVAASAILGTMALETGAQIFSTAVIGPPRSLIDARAGLAAGQNAVTPRLSAMTPAERRQAIDAIWGQGASTTEKLGIFDTFWNYVDQHYVAFDGINVDWNALRTKYRPEVAGGVSRGRFAAIMNQLALALRESHSQADDLLVNIFTLPGPGIPLLTQGTWLVDFDGACETALDDGSALIYAAIPGHPLGLAAGDRILGYDGKPWRTQYQDLIKEELPLFPLWWGSSPSSFDHSFVMAAGANWGLFDTMDIAKFSSGQVVHQSTSQMPFPIFSVGCTEQLPVPGVPRPGFFDGTYVSAGVVDGTNIGYIYSWAWTDDAYLQFADAAYQLTQVQKVDALIVDMRFNVGGFIHAPFLGLGVLFEHPSTTIGYYTRKSPIDHFTMKMFVTPSAFRLDFADGIKDRVKLSFGDKPIALLVGPGAVSAGDLSALWLSDYPNVRVFGKSTSAAFNLPTQPALGTNIDLGPDWSARIAEANAFENGAPKTLLTHREFQVDESVWLTPQDVAVGKDTVVSAALKWIAAQPH